MSERPFVNLNKLEDELKPELKPEPVSLPPEKFIPVKHREIRDNSYSHGSPTFGTQTPLQIIATAIKRLVWDDNEHFALLVEKHKSNDTNMAKAIQMAADDLLKETDER